MITPAQLPEDVALGRSPILVSLVTDRPALEVMVNSARLQVLGSPAVGETLRLQYEGVDVTLTVQVDADDTGQTISQQGALSLADYTELLGEELRGNVTLFLAFEIEAFTNGAGSFIRFNPRQSLAGTWTVTNGLSNITDTILLSTNTEYEENLSVVLVVETANSSLQYDRRLVHRLPVYENSAVLRFNLQPDLLLRPCAPFSNSIGTGGSYFQQCEGSWQRYRLYWAEQYGAGMTSRLGTNGKEYTAIYAGNSYFEQYNEFWAWHKDAGKFLTPGPRRQNVTYEQPTWLYWIGKQTNRIIRIAGRLTRLSGAQETFHRGSYTETRGVPVLLKAGFNQLNLPSTDDPVISYELWLAQLDGTVISEVFTFTITAECDEFTRYFLFSNSHGGCDTVRATGKHTTSIEVETQEGRRSVDAKTLEDGEDFYYNRLSRAVYTGSVGYKSASYIAYLQDLLNSEQAWLIDVNQSRLNPVLIEPGSYRILKDGEDLHTLTFQYSHAWQDAHAGLLDDGQRILVGQSPDDLIE